MKFTASFKFEKSTKNTHKFMEQGPEDDHKVGQLYVQKSAFADKVPDTITVTVEAK